VHLADAGRGGGGFVELGEPGPPPAAELLGEHAVDVTAGHRRSGGLELDQRLAERCGVLVGDGGLEHRQRLAELHRAALELAEHGEQLLRALGHELRGDLFAVAADQPAPPAADRAPGHPEGQAGELGGAGRGAPWNITHLMIVSPSR
jgi:hypothetical protein